MTKKINLIFLSTLILYSLFCALQLGYTWDVLFYYEVGKERLDYLFSLGANKVDEPDHGKYLNGAYSTISAFIVQFFPRKYILESGRNALLTALSTTVRVRRRSLSTRATREFLVPRHTSGYRPIRSLR